MMKGDQSHGETSEAMLLLTTKKASAEWLAASGFRAEDLLLGCYITRQQVDGSLEQLGSHEAQLLVS